MKSVISMSSNCYLSSQQREYVISHLDTISASFDGTPLLQDMQRPCLGGHTSSVRVIETLKELDRKRFCYAIRATVLPEMFEKGMVDSVCWIADNLPNCDQVRFEPVQPQGRGANFKGSLDPFAFLEGFRNARKEGAKRGINVDYSVCRSSHFKSSFCGALGTELNVLVTTKGIITTCNDVLKPDHEKAAVFHIGVIGAAKDEIGIDGDKLNWLRNLSVQDFSTCYKCFARWHCAGDCFGRKPGAINKEQPCELNLFRCTINRELILDDIFLLAIDQNQRIDNEPIERLSNIGG